MSDVVHRGILAGLSHLVPPEGPLQHGADDKNKSSVIKSANTALGSMNNLGGPFLNPLGTTNRQFPLPDVAPITRFLLSNPCSNPQLANISPMLGCFRSLYPVCWRLRICGNPLPCFCGYMENVLVPKMAEYRSPQTPENPNRQDLHPKVPVRQVPTIREAFAFEKVNSRSRVVCCFCPKTFCNKGSFKRHFKNIHLNEKFKCRVPGCQILLSTNRSREIHSTNPNPDVHFIMGTEK